MKKSKFTEEQIVRILQEASTGAKTQAQLCRDHGISVNTFYVWKRKYAGMADGRPAPAQGARAGERPAQAVAGRADLEIDAVRALFRKNGIALPSPWRERGF